MTAVLPIIDDCCADNSIDTEAALRREKKRLKNQSRRKTRTLNRNKSLFNVEKSLKKTLLMVFYIIVSSGRILIREHLGTQTQS